MGFSTRKLLTCGDSFYIMLKLSRQKQHKIPLTFAANMGQNKQGTRRTLFYECSECHSKEENLCLDTDKLQWKYDLALLNNAWPPTISEKKVQASLHEVKSSICLHNGTIRDSEIYGAQEQFAASQRGFISREYFAAMGLYSCYKVVVDVGVWVA